MQACIDQAAEGGQLRMPFIASRRKVDIATIRLQIDRLVEDGYVMREKRKIAGVKGPPSVFLVIVKNLDGTPYKKPAAPRSSNIDGMQITKCPPAYAAGFGMSTGIRPKGYI